MPTRPRSYDQEDPAAVDDITPRAPSLNAGFTHDVSFNNGTSFGRSNRAVAIQPMPYAREQRITPGMYRGFRQVDREETDKDISRANFRGSVAKNNYNRTMSEARNASTYGDPNYAEGLANREGESFVPHPIMPSPSAPAAPGKPYDPSVAMKNIGSIQTGGVDKAPVFSKEEIESKANAIAGHMNMPGAGAATPTPTVPGYDEQLASNTARRQHRNETIAGANPVAQQRAAAGGHLVGNKSDIPVTAEQGAMMRANTPGAGAAEQEGRFHDTLDSYGVGSEGHQTADLTNHMFPGGEMARPDMQPPPMPSMHVPLSMIGPQSGGGVSQPQQAEPGPAMTLQPLQSPTPQGPIPGYTPLAKTPTAPSPMPTPPGGTTYTPPTQANPAAEAMTNAMGFTRRPDGTWVDRQGRPYREHMKNGRPGLIPIQ